MPVSKGEGPVTLSVLDRLIDDEPKNPFEAPMTRSESLRRMKTSVRRDLEWLLNMRLPVQPAPEGATQLEHSLYSSGLPDLHSMNMASTRNRTELARLMEKMIAAFEPRLLNAKVSPVIEKAPGPSPKLGFMIEGLLAIDPMPEHVSFDTLLDVTGGEYLIKGEHSAG